MRGGGNLHRFGDDVRVDNWAGAGQGAKAGFYQASDADRLTGAAVACNLGCGANAAIANICGASRRLNAGPGGGATKTEIQQFGNLGIARSGGFTAKNGCDDALIAPFGRGHQVGARSTGIAGLDAVGTFVGGQQASVCIGNGFDARINRSARKQVIILGVVIQDMATQGCHVAGGGQMPRLGQPMGVFECCACHAERFGGAGHAAGKGGFGSGNGLPNGGGGIIGGFYSGSPNQIAKGNTLSGF